MTSGAARAEGSGARRALPTVADLRALKGRRQLTMLRYFSLDEAAAAEAAGVDIATVPPEVQLDPRNPEVAPSIFSMTGLTHIEAVAEQLKLAARSPPVSVACIPSVATRWLIPQLPMQELERPGAGAPERLSFEPLPRLRPPAPAVVETSLGEPVRALRDRLIGPT